MRNTDLFAEVFSLDSKTAVCKFGRTTVPKSRDLASAFVLTTLIGFNCFQYVSF